MIVYSAMYSIQSISHDLSLSDLAPYYMREHFLAMCRECPNYANIWSCPPYDFQPEALLSRFSRITIWGTKITFDSAAAAACNSRNAAVDTAKKIMAREKRKVDFAVLEQEQCQPDSLALYGGGCRLCRNCSRIWARPCRHSDIMRPSLESLGYDVSAITEHVFNLPLLWFDKRLPEYMLLVTALLYNF